MPGERPYNPVPYYQEAAGILAIASATELAHGYDPVLCSWDTSRVMRDPLLSCLENDHITRFPTTRRQRVYLLLQVPLNWHTAMIQCCVPGTPVG